MNNPIPAIIGCMLLAQFSGPPAWAGADKIIPFEQGQLWNYKTRAEEDHKKSHLFVRRIEDYGKGDVVVHVTVNALFSNEPTPPEDDPTRILRFPISKRALRESVMTLRLRDEFFSDARYDDEVEKWRDAYKAGTAYICDVPVAECIDAMMKK